MRAAQRRSNEEWLRLLRGRGRDAALEDLRLLLLRGLQIGLKRTIGRKAGDLVEDFVQEALVRVLDNLDSFRGESRFITWAQKIGLRVAFSELRRKRWQDVSLDDLLGADHNDSSVPLSLPDMAPAVDDHTSQRMALEVVRRVIEEDLTAKQRDAIVAVMIHGMPLEEVARKMEMNRNALYKLLHDARKRLQSALKERGIAVEEILAEL